MNIIQSLFFLVKKALFCNFSFAMDYYSLFMFIILNWLLVEKIKVKSVWIFVLFTKKEKLTL